MNEKSAQYLKAVLDTYKDNLDIRTITLSTRVFDDKYESGYKDEDIDVSHLSTDDIIKKIVDGSNSLTFEEENNLPLASMNFSVSNGDIEVRNNENKGPGDETYFINMQTNILGDFADADVAYKARINAEHAIGNDIKKPPYSDEQVNSIKHVLEKLRDENIDMRYLDVHSGSSQTISNAICKDLMRVVNLIKYKEHNDSLTLFNMQTYTFDDGKKTNLYGMSTDKLGNLFFNTDTDSAKPSDLFIVESNNLRIKQEPTEGHERIVEILKECDGELGFNRDSTFDM